MKVVKSIESFYQSVCYSNKCHPNEGLPEVVIEDHDLIFGQKKAVITATLYQLREFITPTRLEQWLLQRRPVVRGIIQTSAILAISTIASHYLPESFIQPLAIANQLGFYYQLAGNRIINAIDALAVDVPANVFE